MAGENPSAFQYIVQKNGACTEKTGPIYLYPLVMDSNMPTDNSAP